MPETLIVTNGDIAAARLAAAAPDASVLPWRDMLHDGPVPADLPLRVLSGLRARWLAQEVGLERAEVEATFLARDLRFALVEPGSEVILCLEHDLYDQLQLLQLLAELAPRAGRYTVTLAQADDHLESQEPASLAALLARRQPVSDTAFAAGTALWAAFRATTPEALVTHLGTAPTELPWMTPAIARLLEELPGQDGLTRTERAALRLLDAGEADVGTLFARVSEQEEARWLGDLAFFRRLDALARPPVPLLEGPSPRPRADERERDTWLRSHPRLTAAGRAVLAGRRDALADRPPDRWLGGTRLRPGNVWRWDPRSRRLSRDATNV